MASGRCSFLAWMMRGSGFLTAHEETITTLGRRLQNVSSWTRRATNRQSLYLLSACGELFFLFSDFLRFCYEREEGVARVWNLVL